MTSPRRTFLRGAAAFAAAPWFARGLAFADEPRFALGVASGQPHASGMVLWTRLTGAGLPRQVNVHWQVATDEQFQHIVIQGEETTEADWAHSVHAEPAGLEPRAGNWYRFNALGQQSAVGRTRTAPAADAAATFRFCVTSCQRYDVGHYAAWRQIADDGLDAVFFVGDYIYEYASKLDAVRRHEGGVPHTLDEYRARYATYKSDPQLQAAHAAAPWFLVWDDHEVSNDYANMRPEIPEPDFAARRAAAYRAYWEHMPFPKSVRPDRPGHAHRQAARLGHAGTHPSRRRPPVPRRAGLHPARPWRLDDAAARRLPRPLPIRSERCSASSRSAGWPTAGTCRDRGTCLRNRR